MWCTSCRGTGLIAAVTAFVSGTTGFTGWNIANLYRIKNLEVVEISFGGAEHSVLYSWVACFRLIA